MKGVAVRGEDEGGAAFARHQSHRVEVTVRHAAIRLSNARKTRVFSAHILPAQPERPLDRGSRFGGFGMSRYSARVAL